MERKFTDDEIVKAFPDYPCVGCEKTCPKTGANCIEWRKWFGRAWANMLTMFSIKK